MIPSIDIADKGREKTPLILQESIGLPRYNTVFLIIALYRSIGEEIIEYLDFTIFQQGMLYYVLILTEK